MKEVFISYSTKDAASAETVRGVLEKNGLSCWMAPRDIPGGSNYTKEIPVAIRNCKVFVLILSENAQSSHWVLKELDSAVNCGKVILPFMLEDFVLSDEFDFLLTGAQRYAAYLKKVEVMETLIGRIRGILDAPAASASETVAAAETETVAPKAVKKAEPLYLGEAVCESCGGADLKPLPKRVLRKTAKEKATLLFIPLLGFAFFWLVFILCAFFLPNEVFGLLPVFLVLGFAGGAVWGNVISKNMVRRALIRQRLVSRCYRCNSCGKVFRVDEPRE